MLLFLRESVFLFCFFACVISSRFPTSFLSSPSPPDSHQRGNRIPRRSLRLAFFKVFLFRFLPLDSFSDRRPFSPRIFGDGDKVRGIARGVIRPAFRSDSSLFFFLSFHRSRLVLIFFDLPPSACDREGSLLWPRSPKGALFPYKESGFSIFPASFPWSRREKPIMTPTTPLFP